MKLTLQYTKGAFAFLATGLLGAFQLYAQPVVEGFVRDATTEEGLGLATIQIKDTFRGTIANEGGAFALAKGNFQPSFG